MSDEPAPKWPPIEREWAAHARFHITLNNVDVWTVRWSSRRADKGRIVLLKFGEADHMFRVAPYDDLPRLATVFPEYYDPIRMYLEMVRPFHEL